MEAAGPVTVLAVLDVLYAFFLAVQCAALFGGADYLARAGISYASYARSGFFQLVAVAAVNLACLLACLALCKGEGRGLRMVQVLGTLLVAASGVLLVSALWRMNLYVGAYGLSFKRALTYWGMAVLAVLLAAALWKVWHRHFRWFRVLLSVGAAGWLLLNYANVDALVARYNIGRGLDTGAILSASDGRLGALPALEELLEASDFVSVSVPLSKGTINLVSGEMFDHFKKGAILVNAARGKIVNEENLYAALKDGKLKAAAFDVFEVEPLPKDSKLLTLENFSATPHIGGNTEEALYRTGMEVVENVINVLEGKPAAGIVV